jgi:hypothetical protein
VSSAREAPPGGERQLAGARDASSSPAIRSGDAMSPFAGRGRELVGYGDLGGRQGSRGRRVGGVHPDAPMPVILIVR